MHANYNTIDDNLVFPDRAMVSFVFNFSFLLNQNIAYIPLSLRISKYSFWSTK